jgi:hypothetical protein
MLCYDVYLLFSVVTDPLGDVLNFIRQFNEQYGEEHPIFYEGTYSQVRYWQHTSFWGIQLSPYHCNTFCNSFIAFPHNNNKNRFNQFVDPGLTSSCLIPQFIASALRPGFLTEQFKPYR